MSGPCRPDDPESNYGIAERMLLSPLGAKAPRAIRMPADMPNLGEAALKYDDVLATELRRTARWIWRCLASAKTVTWPRCSPDTTR